ncbi:coiled-coil domain-containing protein 173 [Gouania willdenowi]|uniref:Trichohyalin-plectin-homology domain-containing protein n=1 Tax=Gouania willdenowi TaxID=441366 RepID=A0A8C5DFN9_GOUWI|nr:coiled-coil domain-containing protein 173 [Gouania willdenowi]
METEVQYGRRKGCSKNVKETLEMEPVDLRQTTVLGRAEWQRIQDEVSQVDRERERLKEAAEQREVLHLRSKEVIKLWPNTIAAQRQKKLEAKKIREQIEEERRKKIDVEEAIYQEQKRKEAIEKAETQLYYQTDRVKGLHSALLLTEVLKEREAQLELKHRLKSASKDVDKVFLDVAKTKEEETLRKEQESEKKKKLEMEAVAEDLKNQKNEIKKAKEQIKQQSKKEGEEIQRLRDLFLLEQRMEAERKLNQKRNLMQAHLEHITNRNSLRATEEQKEEAEEEQRKLYLSAKQKMMKLRREQEKALQQEAQMQRDTIVNKLTATRQEQAMDEEQRIEKAVTKQDTKHILIQLQEEEKKNTMLKSIAVHRETMKQEKEQRDKMSKQRTEDELQAKKEADRIFTEKQALKASKIKQEERKLQDFNAAQMAEKCTKQQQLKNEEVKFELKNAELMVQEEEKFQQYSRHMLDAASQAQRNVIPLCKAAREGIGGGFGPVFGGVRPSYIVHDQSGAQMPKYITGTTESIKKLHEAGDIHDAKRRLGFTW